MDQYVQRFESWRKEREITPALLFEYWDNMNACPYLGNSSRNRHIQQLRPYINEIRLRKALPFVKTDIYDALKLWPVEAREPQVLDSKQVKALVVAAAQADPRMGAFVLLGLTTGARCSEIWSIKLLNWRPDHIVVNDSKRSRDKRIPLKWSASLQAMASGPQWPMWGFKNVPPTPIWRKLLDAAGLSREFEPRILRRTAASFAASSGKVPAVWLAEWFGHSNQVADRFYRLAQSEANGDTIEQWYGCPEEFKALLRSLAPVVVESVPQTT